MRTSSIAQIQPKEQGLGWIVRRLLLYIGLALAALTVFSLFFALTVRLGILDKVNGWFRDGWVGFVAYTALLFWITVRESRRRWSHWSFWLAIACLLAIHCFAFTAVLRAYPDWRVVWFWPITVAEAGIFGGVLWWLFPKKHKTPKQREY